MSAWERAKHLPWDRIPASAENLEAQRERLFRELQRETMDEELLRQQRHDHDPIITTSSEPSSLITTNTAAAAPPTPALEKIRIPYSNMECLRQVAFGGTIGSVTGGMFGFMDAMRHVQESAVLINLSNVAKSRYLLSCVSRNAAVFGVFFAGYHVTKYGVRVTVDPGLGSEIAVGSAVSLGALAARPVTRPCLPYATMLLGLDTFHVLYRDRN